MTRTRTPIITLNITQWMAITARMPRMVKSVYHDICLYSWETARPVPDAELVLMLADTEGQGDRIVDALVKSGGLERDEAGNVWSTWALAEAERAYALWAKKSNGGRIASENRRAAPTYGTISDRTVEYAKRTRNESNRGVAGDAPLNLPSEPALEMSPITPIATLIIKNDDSKEPPTKPVSAGACAEVFASWNAVAKPAGLPVAAKMTGSREGAIRARIEELGPDAITQALAIVPTLALNTKVSDLDWFLRPATIPGIIEGDFTPAPDSEIPNGK
jgi:hypothetical protein